MIYPSRSLGSMLRKYHPSTQVSIIFRPAFRFLTRFFPLEVFAARFLAAVILPPLLFFAILSPRLRSVAMGTWPRGK
jgi:hypothetical protein